MCRVRFYDHRSIKLIHQDNYIVDNSDLRNIRNGSLYSPIGHILGLLTPGIGTFAIKNSGVLIPAIYNAGHNDLHATYYNLVGCVITNFLTTA